MDTNSTLSAAGTTIASKPAEVIPALFFTELWERFSFYGMRAVLLFFLYYPPARGGLGLPTQTALSQVTAYATLTYLSGALGGWAADRLWGARRAVLYGGMAIAAGHVLLALPATLSGTYTGLLLIVLGTGLLKTNVSIVVGAAYPPGETQRRIAGFALFYVGVSLGGFLGPIVVGFFQQQANFHVAFGITAVGILAGLACFVARWNRYGDITKSAPNPLSAPERRRLVIVTAAVAAGLAIVVGWLASQGWLTSQVVVNILTWCTIAVAANYFRQLLGKRGTTPESRERVRRFVPVFAAGALFAMLANQQFSVLSLFAANRVQTTVFGWTFPVAWLTSVETVGILLLGPFLSLRWSRRTTGGIDPGRRAAYALGIAGTAFGVIALGDIVSGAGPVSALWIVVAYLMMSFCELNIASSGLSTASRIGGSTYTSQGMGLWFCGGAVGNGIGAQVVKLFTLPDASTYLLLTAVATVLVALVLVVLTRAVTHPEVGR